MTPGNLLHYGTMPVPFAALWSAEQGGIHVARCPHIDHLALCDVDRRGEGKPIFGKPHMGRQRQLIVNDLCDLCAKPLKARTKVSLSHAREVVSGGAGMTVMQVEPMVHKDCARTCVEHCPSLKHDIRNGTLFVRQVLKHRHQVALLAAAAVEEFTGERREGCAGHAKIELLRWKNRDLNWLMERRHD
ncbi:hypothetical protein [Rhizobium sp. LC145]|uniref:hypothetical protein n=1 Tax=Rhizobium sp. LC145 TaxID=1120688 RepID=UPI000629E6CC|nr:hypothetical protein [Rhizobium sp. LC145]KKX24337.1 hypothetical protein YH62_27710 [Rhizobium sp. LC145]TKT46154.1 hypothetical protein FDR95_23625 [Rhizobiaceae bacterium LC148]